MVARWRGDAENLRIAHTGGRNGVDLVPHSRGEDQDASVCWVVDREVASESLEDVWRVHAVRSRTLRTVRLCCMVDEIDVNLVRNGLGRSRGPHDSLLSAGQLRSTTAGEAVWVVVIPHSS